jgi:hypothetical protein
MSEKEMDENGEITAVEKNTPRMHPALKSGLTTAF